MVSSLRVNGLVYLVFTAAVVCASNFYASNVSASDEYRVEWVTSVGIKQYSKSYRKGNEEFDGQDYSGSDAFVSFVARNRYGKNKKHTLGIGADISQIQGQIMLGFRAVDYQYLLTERLRLGTFIGAASLQSGAPQNGYYYGANLSYLNFWHGLGVSVEWSRGDGMARDRLPSDPDGFKPDIFIDINQLSLGVVWQF